MVISNNPIKTSSNLITHYRRQNSSSLMPAFFTEPAKFLQHRRCAHECPVIFALLSFCVSVIVKGVAYDNSRWANYDEVDVFNNKEQFPVMSNFLDIKSNFDGVGVSKCDEAKCKNFFEKLNALQTVALTHGRPPVQLRGTFSRGVNRRCERLSLSDGSPSKYDKCLVDKQVEINEFRTIRFLLIGSMVAECFAICAWVLVFVRPVTYGKKSTLTRLGLVLAAMLGFVGALLTGLACGLFAQAVDIFDDPHIFLGWPFYATFFTAILAIFTCIIAASMLRSHEYDDADYHELFLTKNSNNSEAETSLTNCDEETGPFEKKKTKIAAKLPKKISQKDRAASTPEIRRPCVSFEHV